MIQCISDKKEKANTKQEGNKYLTEKSLPMTRVQSIVFANVKSKTQAEPFLKGRVKAILSSCT